MSSQISLFDDDAQRSQASTDVLFFALQPDAGAVGAIAGLGKRLRTQHGLIGKPHAAERLHVTLYFIGEFSGVPQDLVGRACKVLSAFRAPSFDVCFDRVMSFRRKSSRPVVLVGSDSQTSLHQFQSRLRSALLAAHLPEPDRKPFTPHVTLLYDDRGIPEQGVTPVCWRAREFVLVRSLHGRGQHQVLARFPIDDRL